TVDTLKYPNGLARLIVKAYDTKGFSSEKSFYFNIYNEVREAQMWALWESVGTLISRYAFLPAVAVGFVTMLIGYGLAKWRSAPKQQPIVIRIDSSILKKSALKKGGEGGKKEK
ncbi:MAG: hypothetical protein B6U76_00905, partial [Desulfurococcales archaeon ex4484_217_2]